MTVRNLDALLRPRQVLALGAPAGVREQQLLDNLRRSLPAGQLIETPDGAPGAPGAPAAADLAVFLDPALATAERIDALGAAGVRALLLPGNAPPPAALLQAARRYLMRLLGHRSVGVAVPGRLDASSLPIAPLAGSTALIVQSQSVAAAAVDWAVGRRLGFSWIAVTGAEDDVDVADLLDYAALDPATRTVAVQLGCIRGARKFMSAARACARAKPVVVLQSPLPDATPHGPDRTRSAAFARAGLVEIDTLPGLFDALAALQRLPPPGEGRVVVVGNGAGICALAVDAAHRQGLTLVSPSADLRAELSRALPELRFPPGSVDLGASGVDDTVAVLRRLLACGCTDAVLLVHSPAAGASHAALAEALTAAAFGERLLTVWLGLESALLARQRSTEAGLATFTSPDAAARALRYRHAYARNQELLTETPPEDPLPPRAPQRLAATLERRRERGSLAPYEVWRALHDYGIGVTRRQPHADVLRLDVQLQRHDELGMHLRVARAGLPPSPPADAFAPLDLLLAQRTLESVGLRPGLGLDARDIDALAAALVRVGRMLMDQPRIAALQLRLFAREGLAHALSPARIEVAATPLPDRARLALAPYPFQLTHEATLHDGRRYLVRAIRPSDEPALIRLLESLRPEDIRLRFFRFIRHFTHAMAARMTQIDYDRELTLVALPLDDPARVVGLATLVSDPDGAQAEYAIIVHHEHGRAGLGRHLMCDLLAQAQQRGIGRVFGEVLHENTGMLRLAAQLGFRRERQPDDPGSVHVVIEPAQLALAAGACGIG